MVYVIQDCRQLASRVRMERHGVPSWSWSQAVSIFLWHIPLLCVQWKTPDVGQMNCPKHVEFHSKNKFEKLVHLVGFTIRIVLLNGHRNVKFLWNFTPFYMQLQFSTENIPGSVTCWLRFSIYQLELWDSFMNHKCIFCSTNDYSN
jgi:hypothetical protein